MDLKYRNLFNNAIRTYDLVPKDVGKFLALSKGGFGIKWFVLYLNMKIVWLNLRPSSHSALHYISWKPLQGKVSPENSALRPAGLLDRRAGRSQPGCSPVAIRWDGQYKGEKYLFSLAESYSHRAGVRARLGGDAAWQEEYFQQILPWLQHQDNLTLERWPQSSLVLLVNI